MKLLSLGTFAWAVTLTILVGCGQSEEQGSSTPLQDPISEMGDAWEIDIKSLPTQEGDASAFRTLATPIEVPAPLARQNDAERAEAGVDPARWELYATFDLAPPNGVPPAPPVVADIGSDIGRADTSTGPVIVLFPHTGRAYRVTRPESDFEKLRALYEAKGRNLPLGGEPQGQGADEPSLAKALFSDNVDNRTPRGVWEYSETTWPYNTIAQVKQDDGVPIRVNDFETLQFRV